MYSNYSSEDRGFHSDCNLTARSMFTKDVNDDLNFNSDQVSMKSYSILEHSNNKNNKCRNLVSIAPSKHPNSCFLVNETTMQNPQSCLMEDFHCDLKQKDIEVSCSENEKPSRRSDSFVKKLVASLERRQRENEELQRRPLSVPNKLSQEHLTICVANKQQVSQQYAREELQFDDSNYERYETRPRSMDSKNLEKNCKNTKEVENNNNSFDSQDSNSEYFWEQEDEILPLPVYYSINNESAWTVPSASNSNSNKSSMRRTFKNMLSSIMNWRAVKTLPKGSRDYYAARESLGEEMRAFRRDTMPRLMERAVIKSCLLPCKSEAQAERTSRASELSELLARTTSRAGDISPKPCIATIHPIYGNKTTVGLQQQQTSAQREGEVICRSKRIEVPPLPSNCILDSKSLQKRLSREAAQELVRKVESRQKQAPYSEPADYDIPRKLKLAHRSTQESIASQIDSHSAAPQYENFNSIVADDKRLHCTIFTTF